MVTDPSDAAPDLTTGDGQGGDVIYFVPSELDGLNLLSANACLVDPATGSTTVQIHNVTQAVDMLTGLITIDSTENCSMAGTPGVVDTANDDVAEGDGLRVDLDSVGSGARGLSVILTFG